MSEDGDGRELPAGVGAARSAIARSLASTLQLGDVFSTVAAAARSLLPFDRMAISLVEGDGTVRVFLAAGEGADGFSETVRSRDQYSDRLWPARGGSAVRIRDAPRELDPAFEVDRRVVEAGNRSVFAFSLEAPDRQLGVLWFVSSEAGAFSDAHVAALGPVADLLALAVEHDRLWTREQERRRRHDKLEALLPAIADALDVRAVFPKMSALIQDVIPHVTVALALVTPDGGGVKVRVASNYDVSDLPEYRFTDEAERISSAWRSFVAYDCEVLEEGVTRIRTSPPEAAEPVFTVLRPGPTWTGILTKLGIRSLLRVPIRVRQQTVGAISFGAGRPAAYGPEDVALATRIADHVALALAHEELAEEARRAAQAQERAALLEERVSTLVEELEGRGGHRALGESKPWKHVLTLATRVAGTDTTVLITGESGTGKEVIARYIHRGSPRADKPFVAVNCAALPEQLLESELFGHERGAFTGAVTSRPGKIEQAAGGVLFLDEVGEMTPAVQAKFLRFLQEREFQRLGSARTLRADVRVIAATNRDPRAAMERGALREDLYYRLSVFEIPLPPLRQRRDDILMLAAAFLEELGKLVGRPAGGISDDARDQLLIYAWPGNVRELRNAIERAVILCDGGLVTREHLPISVAEQATPPVSPSASSPPPVPAGGQTLGAVERDLVVKALATADNNKSRAAKLLGVNRGQLYSLLKRHGLTDARR
jgi:transcriptional regulator with GAF, ATPase, and Fis domain